jgi:hypothetical protein
MGRDYDYDLRLPTGLVLIPHMIYQYGLPLWNDTNRRKPKNSEKTRPNATSSTTNPIWTDQGANMALRCERPPEPQYGQGTH